MSKQVSESCDCVFEPCEYTEWEKAGTCMPEGDLENLCALDDVLIGKQKYERICHCPSGNDGQCSDYSDSRGDYGDDYYEEPENIEVSMAKLVDPLVKFETCDYDCSKYDTYRTFFNF